MLELLRAAGYIVEWLTDTQNATRWIADEAPNLIILDLDVAGHDLVVSEAVGLSSRPHVLGAAARPEVLVHAHAIAGVTDFVALPCNSYELLARTARLLRRRESMPVERHRLVAAAVKKYGIAVPPTEKGFVADGLASAIRARRPAAKCPRICDQLLDSLAVPSAAPTLNQLARRTGLSRYWVRRKLREMLLPAADVAQLVKDACRTAHARDLGQRGASIDEMVTILGAGKGALGASFERVAGTSSFEALLALSQDDVLARVLDSLGWCTDSVATRRRYRTEPAATNDDGN